MDYNQKAINNLNDKTMQNANLQDLNNPPSKNREFNINSESIVSFFMEKFISHAITGAKRNKIEAEIPSKCFKYVTNIINNYIKMEYLPYDRDDRNILVPNSKKKEIPISNNNSDNKKQKSSNANNLNINIKSNSNNVIVKNFNSNNNVENADINGSSQNNFLNRSLSNNNEQLIKQLEYDQSSMDESENNEILSQERDVGAEAENEFFKTNDNVSNLNFGENYLYFFDNKFFGVNDWTVCDEPVNYYFCLFLIFFFTINQLQKSLCSEKKLFYFILLKAVLKD